MSSKEMHRGRQVTESDRSSTSILNDKAKTGFPSSSKAELEVEEIQIIPIRRSFSKRRCMNAQKLSSKSNKPLRITNQNESRSSTNNKQQSKIVKKLSETDNMPILKRTLNSKILSQIDLSIISQSRNQSKLETPQNKKALKTICCQRQQANPPNLPTQPTTFTKWVISRKPPIKKDHQNQKTIQFSSNQICDASIDPCLLSFRQNRTLNETFIKENAIGFKEGISKSCDILPNMRNIKIKGCQALNKRQRSKKKNEAAKRITTLQSLFAQKGIDLATNAVKILTNNRMLKLCDILPQAKKEESRVYFEKSLDDEA